MSLVCITAPFVVVGLISLNMAFAKLDQQAKPFLSEVIEKFSSWDVAAIRPYLADEVKQQFDEMPAAVDETFQEL